MNKLLGVKVKRIGQSHQFKVPSNRLHKLTRDRKEQHNLTIKNQYRICFYWLRGNAYEVEIVDYH